MGHTLENPLVRRCRDFAAKVAGGHTDCQNAAGLVIKEAKTIADVLEPKWRQEYLSDAADQIEAAGEAHTDNEIFITVAGWLRGEASGGPA
jgi:hypothetical protein